MEPIHSSSEHLRLHISFLSLLHNLYTLANMFKFIVLVSFLIVVASGQYLGGYLGLGDYGHNGYNFGSAPSLHGPFSSSVNTGIRRFGSTAGYVAAAPAYVAAAPAYVASSPGAYYL